MEQDIEQIWHATQAAISQAMHGLSPRSIKAIGVSSQGGAMQVLDSHDRPCGRVISWLDSRGQPYDAEYTAERGSKFFAKHVGHAASGVAIGQALRLRAQSPQLLRLPNRIGFVGDVIVGRLCGHRAHDATSLGIALFYNPWLRQPDPDVLARLGLKNEQLPCLLPATDAAGMLQESAAQTIGLPPGIPVSPAVHDQYAASIGAASVGEGDVSFGAGTAWVLLANQSHLALPVSEDAYVCAHPVDGLYGQLLSIKNGGAAIQSVMCLLGNEPATTQRVDRTLEAVPPGSDGLRFWPCLSEGPSVEGLSRTGGRFSRITSAHSRNHLVRAVVEGLACELLRHVRLLTGAGLLGCRLVMCGSAAVGRHTPQIIANVTNLPVSCVEVSNVSAFGAAMIARKLVATDVPLAEIGASWAPSRRTVHPGEHVSVYRDLLQEYLALFDNSAMYAAN